MAWNNLTFVECSLLTAAKMTQLQDNFLALAGGAAGAPPLAVNSLIASGVGSLATVHAESGFLGPEVSSFGTLHVESGLVAPEVSSFGRIEVASGLVSGGISSLNAVSIQQLTLPDSTRIGHLSVDSGLHVPPAPGGTPPPDTLFAEGVLRAAVNFDGSAATIYDAIRGSFNVSSLADNGAGDYTILFAQPMPSEGYWPTVTAGNSGSGGTTPLRLHSLTTSSFRFQLRSMADNPVDRDIVSVVIFGPPS